MNPIPFMPFYVADYMIDTVHLTTVEHGAYMLLIIYYWQSGRSLPKDDKKLAAIAKMTMAQWQEISPSLREFFYEEEGVLRHKRIDEELEKARLKIEKATFSSQKAVEARQKKAAMNSSNEPLDDRAVTESSPTDDQVMTERLPIDDQSMTEGLPTDNRAVTYRDRDKEFNIIHTPYNPPQGVCEKAQGPPDELFIAIRKAFQSKHPTGFANTEKEISSIFRLCEIVHRARSPDEMGFARKVLEKFWRLTTSGEKFWKKHPFLPSRLVSNWPGVLKELENETSFQDTSIIDKVLAKEGIEA